MGPDENGDFSTIDRLLESTLESIDSAESLATEVARVAGFDEDDLAGIGMAVRECMANAVKHGNRFSALKKVRLRVTRAGQRIEVVISDQGAGFVVEDVPDPLAAENLMRSSGRGVFLMRAFMDEFHVRRLAPEGMEVTLVKVRAEPN